MNPVEKIFIYDHEREGFTVEFWIKQAQLSDVNLLTICLPDAANESGKSALFVERGRAAITSDQFEKFTAELRKWRGEAGDHL